MIAVAVIGNATNNSAHLPITWARDLFDVLLIYRSPSMHAQTASTINEIPMINPGNSLMAFFICKMITQVTSVIAADTFPTKEVMRIKRDVSSGATIALISLGST